MTVKELEVLIAAGAAQAEAEKKPDRPKTVTVTQAEIAAKIDGAPRAASISRQVVDLARRGHLKGTKTGPGARDPKVYAVTAKGKRILTA